MSTFAVENNSSKSLFNKSRITVFVLFCVVLVVSVCAFLLSHNGKRMVFMFESENGDELLFEERYIKASGDMIKAYVDEILLGSMLPDAKPLFPAGTKVLSCMLRGRTLYVDLSEEALQIEECKATKTLDASEIFKRNLFTNFRNIDIINLYIVGREVYVIEK